MSGLKELSDTEIDMVHAWLRTMNMPVNRKIHRDYADGVLIAKLMKKLYPRLMEAQIYQTHNGYDLKVVNWRRLSFKVFNRIGIQLTRKQIHDLAMGEHNMLEQLLWEVMAIAPKRSSPAMYKSFGDLKRSVDNLRRSSKLFTKRLMRQESSEGVEADMYSESTSLTNQKGASSNTIVFGKRSHDKIVDVTEQGMVPFAIYEGVINEVRAKDNTIRAFKTKVAILERLIQERDKEISNLRHKSR